MRDCRLRLLEDRHGCLLSPVHHTDIQLGSEKKRKHVDALHTGQGPDLAESAPRVERAVEVEERSPCRRVVRTNASAAPCVPTVRAPSRPAAGAALRQYTRSMGCRSGTKQSLPIHLITRYAHCRIPLTQLDLLFPCAPEDAEASSQALTYTIQTLAGKTYPCMAHVPLTLFLTPTFVAHYIHSGALYAMSMTHLDTQDTACLDGQGMLILSLTKDTYQTLGLVGRPCRFSRGASGRMGDRKSGPVSRYRTCKLDSHSRRIATTFSLVYSGEEGLRARLPLSRRVGQAPGTTGHGTRRCNMAHAFRVGSTPTYRCVRLRGCRH